MALERAKAFNGMENVEVTSVCSRQIERTGPIAKLTGAKGYDNYCDMLGDVDAVVVCTPNYLHKQYALEAMQGGCDVLVEYPLVGDIQEADDLLATAQDKQRVLMVGNTIIHEAMFAYLSKHRERLGDIISASSRVAFYSNDIANVWYMNKEYTGSVFAGLLYHHIEYYRHFLGEARWVLGCDQSIVGDDSQGICPLAGGSLMMGHDKLRTSCIQWFLSAKGDGLPRGLWLNGTESSVTIVSQSLTRSQVIWNEGKDDKTEYIDDEWGVLSSCEDFVKAIGGQLDHKQRLESDMATLRTAMVAERSSRSGEKLSLD